MSEALRFTAVDVGYRGHPPALRGVSLVVDHGAFVLVQGRSGSGKSTLLRTALGLLPPLAGEVRRAEGRSAMVAQAIELDDLHTVSVAEVVDEIVLSLQPVIDARQHEVVVDVADDVTVLADPSGLEQVISNLLHNAAKYTPEVGRIIVRATQRHGCVVIDVEDNGPGIPPGQRERVFERFYRVDAGRSRDMGGTGLGLSIVKHLVAIMDGDVAVGSATPRGARFTVTLPSGALPVASAR